MPDPAGVRPTTDLSPITPHDALRAIEQRFGPAKSGRLFCPVHEADGGRHTPDFTAKVQGDKLVVHCFANCPQDAVVAELKSLGMWPTPPPRERRTPLRSWIWRTADGTKRKMNEWEIDGRKKKVWSKKRSTTPPPRELLFVEPSACPGPAPIIFCEGPTSAGALTALGFRAVGVQGGRTTAESLARFNPGARFIYWPDHDASGYTQMDRFTETATAAGFKVAAIDPLLVNPEAPRKFDPRDWKPGDDPGRELAAAEVDLDVLEDRPRQGFQVVSDWKSAPGIERVLEVIGWRHRRNVRAGRDEIQRDDGPWVELDDQLECLARTTLIPAKCQKPAGDDKTVPLEIGRQTFYDAINAHGALEAGDPFIEYLDALPEWDGQTRNWINGCFPSTAGDELADWAGLATLIACVRLAYKPGDQQDETVVLAGEQKAGKTSAIRLMFPAGEGDDWYELAPPMDCKLQELKEKVRGPVVMEFGELAGSSRADLSRIKGWLTATKDRGRDAYARNVTSAPRRCITMGTVDQNDALPIDPAGNRRWVVVPVEEGEGHKAHVLRWWTENREQAWAQALSMYRQGHPHHLPDELGGKQAERNEHYRRRDEVVEDALDTYLAGWSVPVDGLKFLDVMDEVKKRTGALNNLSGRVTLALKNAGYRNERIALESGERVRRFVRGRGSAGGCTGTHQGVQFSGKVGSKAYLPEKPPADPRPEASPMDSFDPVDRPLTDPPKQPHVEHVDNLGGAFADTAAGSVWSKPTAVETAEIPCVETWRECKAERAAAEAAELTEEQEFIEAMGADLRAIMATAGKGQVLETFDWWVENNGATLDAAIRIEGES